jgi:starch synthase
MRILFAASEMTPYAKTGGLGDVVGALPLALSEFGHEVICCLPYYRCVRDAVPKAKSLGLPLHIPLGNKVVTGDVLEARVQKNVRLVLIRREEFFDRSNLYGAGERDYEDNAERFLFFSKAIAELLGRDKFRSDVVHCHDWQTGFVPVATTLRRTQRGPESGVPTVFTVHNLAYQGLFRGEDFALTNLPGGFFTLDRLEFHGRLNLLKGGIVFADAVTTVSRKYAEEIQTPEQGWGLDPLLRSRKEKLRGILNGADYRTWDPAQDAWLAERYSTSNLSGKKACRAELIQLLDLAVTEATPIAAFISRLAEQKGVDLVVQAARGLLRRGVVVVVLGTGDPPYEQALADLARRFPRQVAVHLDFTEALAHKIQGGADLLLMPSRFEPCGLTPMYALKYGTIPVVRATGGLDDTVTQWDARTGKGNGFKFAELSANALTRAIGDAVAVYKRPRLWQKLMRNAMACDFSWRRAAREYEKLYAGLINAPRR